MRVSMFSVVLVLVFDASCSKSTESPPVVTSETTETTQKPTEPKNATYELSSEQMVKVFESPVQTLSGIDTTLGTYRGEVLLLVNVASECGLTPQYEELQALQESYAGKAFTVIGFPCNQFGGQEPGTPEEILAFASENYGISFPLMQKIETNGPGRHPIYQALTEIKDANDKAGDVVWNFEKFVISADGRRITRFRPDIAPQDPQIIEAIEAGLR